MKDNLFLIEPDIKFKEAFQAMTNEYLSFGEIEYYEMYKDSLSDFPRYVKILENYSKGEGLAQGWSPGFTYWLTNESKKILGVLRLRKEASQENGHIGFDISPLQRQKGLGIAILNLGLKKAKEQGLFEILLTCDFDNIASKKIIENNGGVFESEFYNDSESKKILCYRITL